MTRTKQTARKIPSGKFEEEPRPSKRRVTTVISKETKEDVPKANKRIKKRVAVAPPSPPPETKKKTTPKKKRTSKKKASDAEPNGEVPKKKRPGAITGYILFMKEQRPIVKEQNPSLDFVGMSKKMGEEWAALSEIEKDRYKKEAVDLKTKRAELDVQS